MRILAIWASLIMTIVLEHSAFGAIDIPAVRQVLKLSGNKNDGDFKSVVDEAQKAWLRPKGVERWQMPERFSEKRHELMPLFQKLGLIEAVHAKQKSKK